jgi:hypothetical protein
VALRRFPSVAQAGVRADAANMDAELARKRRRV